MKVKQERGTSLGEVLSGHLEVAGMSDSKGFLEWVQMVAYFIDDWKETQREQLFTIVWRAGSKAAGSKAVAKT